MKDKKIVQEIPFARPGITLVRREGDDYWQMKNSDGDVWGMFRKYYEGATIPLIYRTYELSEGKRPFRVWQPNNRLGDKYVDTNGYFSDYYYEDFDSGYYRDGRKVTWVKRYSYPKYAYHLARDCDGNYSQRVFWGSKEYGHFNMDFFDKVSNIYYDYCFEKNGKVKPVFELKTIQVTDNGTQLLMEDEKSPINIDVKKDLNLAEFVPQPLYFFKDEKGELSEAFYKACKYTDGWAKVQKYYYDKCIHYRDEKGNLSIPFKEGTDYFNGYAVVKVDDDYCIRDTEGNLSTEYFKSQSDAVEEIKAGNAKKYFKKRILDTKVDEKKLDSYYMVEERNGYNFRSVRKYVGGDYQFVDKDGNLSEPFYAHYGKDPNKRYVKKFWNSKGYQLLDPQTGNLSQEVYFVASGYDSNGCASVQLKPNGPYYLMDKDGNMSEPFGEIDSECNGFRVVQKSFFHPYQIIDKNWHLSQKKYPNVESAYEEIRKNDFKFEKENQPTIKPRPKKVKQNYKKKERISLIASMVEGSSTNIKTDDETLSKTKIERYLDNEISVYELDEECFKGEILDMIINHETNNYIQAIMYFDSGEKKDEIRKQALETAEYIKHMATLHLQADNKTIDYETAPIF